MKVSDFDFELPNELIASHPLERRDASRMLVLSSPPVEGCPTGGVVRDTTNYKTLPFNEDLKQRAKELRNAGSLPEALLWKEIKNKKLNGLDFDRQKIIGNYIVDFFCASSFLVIEIDDKSSHELKYEYDEKRDEYLKSLNLKVIHIPASDVLKDPHRVYEWLSDHPAAMPHPSAGGELSDKHITDFISYLRPGDVVVFNNSKVIPARFDATANDGTKYEITLHTSVIPAQAGNQCAAGNNNIWLGFAKKFQKLKIGEKLKLDDGTEIEIMGKSDESGLTIKFYSDDVFAVLDSVGKMPLPPYMKREEEMSDRERYQTIYANPVGSMAAPTAGLHFTNELLDAVRLAGAEIVNITLHVGAGTWAPIKTEDTENHKMHSEWGVITQQQADIINNAKQRGGRIIAIGTTSLRLLESAARPQQGVSPSPLRTDKVLECTQQLESRGVSPSPLRRGARGEGSIYNNEPHHQSRIYTKQLARNMRNKPTASENKLWQELKHDKKGFGFRRQFSIDDRYIADFVCLKKKLIIEVDGIQHQDFNNDEKRTRYLSYQGFRVVRFWNWEIMKEISKCLEIIEKALNDEDVNAVYDVEIQPVYKNNVIIGFKENETKIGINSHAFLSGKYEPSPLTPLRKGEGDTPVHSKTSSIRKGEGDTPIISPFCGTTNIFITPGYKFQVVDVLLTNFHLPKSTLFMLVSAFAGLPEMRAAYAHAVLEKYRFFSYGDCCLLFKKED